MTTTRSLGGLQQKLLMRCRAGLTPSRSSDQITAPPAQSRRTPPLPARMRDGFASYAIFVALGSGKCLDLLQSVLAREQLRSQAAGQHVIEMEAPRFPAVRNSNLEAPGPRHASSCEPPRNDCGTLPVLTMRRRRRLGAGRQRQCQTVSASRAEPGPVRHCPSGQSTASAAGCCLSGRTPANAHDNRHAAPASDQPRGGQVAWIFSWRAGPGPPLACG